MNIYFGLSDYWKTEALLKIHTLFKKRKILNKRDTLFNENNKDQIKQVNEKIVE